MKSLNEMQSALHQMLTMPALRKLTLSRPMNEEIIRTEGRLFEKNGETYLQLETFHKDGKATHRNYPANEGARAVFDCLLDPENGYGQLNLLSPIGDLEARKSKSGNWLLGGKLKKEQTISVSVASHNHEKQYILSEGEVYPFLIRLGICSPDGRILDKKRPKFLQINKFLENVEAVYERLPKDGVIHVLDLCCGKSYLTFAVYHYLTVMKGREVKMLGADLKKDVIAYCSDIANKLNYHGLSFVCCDIGELKIDQTPDMVLSLHACDIATDIVLAKAIVTGARIVLSTPCCHHEAMEQISRDGGEMARMLSPITDHSLLRQKLCDALTDGLRCKMLQAYGYDVTVSELIDPEQTPKNLIIRAFKKGIDEKKQAALLEEYHALCRLFGYSPFLENILREYQK